MGYSPPDPRDLEEMLSIKDRLFMRISGVNTGLNRFSIQEAYDQRDIELLRVYFRILGRDNSATDIKSAAMILRDLGISLESLTMEHLAALDRVRLALSRANGDVSSYFEEEPKVTQILFKDLTRQSLILQIIEDRRISDAATLQEILDETDSVHNALGPGVL